MDSILDSTIHNAASILVDMVFLSAIAMKAIILRGKYKGQVVDISQWCNDWFTIDSDNIDLAVRPFSPAALLFTDEGYNTIRKHKNNGTLFQEFVPFENEKKTQMIDGQIYCIGFKKRKFL